MKKIFLFLSAMLISIISFAQNPLHEVTTETLNYTFLASEEAEATVEEIDDVVVYTISGLGSLNNEPVEFELNVNVMNKIEGMIGETFVEGEATDLFDEDGLLTVFGTAKDEDENTYTIEMSVEITEEEPTVEIVFTETVDVTLYNLTLEPQGPMATVNAGGEVLSFWLTLLPTENYYGFYFSDSFSNIWYGDAQLQPYGDGQYTPDGLTVAFTSIPDAEGKAILYNFTLIPGELPTTALDNIQVGNETMKVIRDGQLIIIKNDVEYNIQGAVVK